MTLHKMKPFEFAFHTIHAKRFGWPFSVRFGDPFNTTPNDVFVDSTGDEKQHDVFQLLAAACAASSHWTHWPGDALEYSFIW